MSDDQPGTSRRACTNEGSNNLDIMESAPKYLAHVGRLVRKELPDSGLLVDFGAGNGLQTLHVIQPCERLICVENDVRRAADLEGRGFKVVGNVNELNQGSVRATFSINCLEHIQEDEIVLGEIYNVLEPGGILVLYVPAHPSLYGAMDQKVGHFRRYSKNELRTKVEAQGFFIDKLQYVDSVGAIVSLVYKWIGNSSGKPGKLSVAIFDRFLFPISIYADRFTRKRFGKNLFMVARTAN